MDINKLALLCDVADTNNLTLSAERMGYTQSGVSHAISKLEAEMGIPLIKRTKHGVELTSEGSLLLPYIRMVVTHYQRMDDVVDSILGLQRGSICIGTYCSIASQWLPEIIRKYQQLYPNIVIRIREGGIRDIERWLYEGSIDFGFLSWKKNQNFKFLSLARDPLYAILPKNSMLPENYLEHFPITAFADYPFIASENGVDHDVNAALEQSNVTPMTSFTCHDDHTIIPMVEKGLGFSLLPDMFLKGLDSNVLKVPVTPCSVRTLGIGILSERTLSTCAKAFIKLSQKMISEMIHNERD
ncbi:LysR family transcriptional regulator [Dorea sp.]